MKRSTWLTDQDVAFAIAQWCSGITQREIAGHFSYKIGSTAPISSAILRFIRKYYPEARITKGYPYFDDRKLLAKIAFCHFMAQREEAA